MRIEDIDFSDAPRSYSFHRKLHKNFLTWLLYCPTTLEADLPLGKQWHKILYWLPRIKKTVYRILLEKGYIEAEKYLFVDLGIDEAYFRKDYSFFIKRLFWMHKNNNANTHFGETL